MAVVTDEAWTAVAAAMTTLKGGADEQVLSISDVIEHEWWRRFTLPNGAVVTHPSFASFVRTDQLEGLGIHDPRAWARSLSEFSHYKQAAGLIVRALGDAISKANEVDENRMSNTHPQDRHDADSVIGRLKRDYPELADEVINGTVTPHAAAVRAGIHRPRATFATNDVRLAVDALLRHYDKAEIIEALT